MNLFKLILLLASLTVVFTNSWGAQKASSHGRPTQLELNDQAVEKYKVADVKMNALYQELTSRLETPETLSRLRDSQRAWIIFRDKACSYEAGPREKSGSNWHLVNQNCMEYHTKKRTEDLEKYLSCTQNGCPN